MIEKGKVRRTIVTPRTIRTGVYGGRYATEKLEHRDTEDEERERGDDRVMDRGALSLVQALSTTRDLTHVLTRLRGSHSD